MACKPSITRPKVPQHSRAGLRCCRQMMWRMLGADDPMEAHKVDSRGIYARGRSEDVKKGVTSFLEKRPAKFKNRCRAHAALFSMVGRAGV